MGAERLPLLVLVGELGLDRRQALLRVLVLLAADRLALDLELFHPALHRVQLLGQRIDLDPELRRGLVHQVDRLVRQEPVG